jgi:hypothetical protein
LILGLFKHALKVKTRKGMKKKWGYVPEDIYRSGNSTSPKLDHVRINRGSDKDDDIATIVINGITYVYPNSEAFQSLIHQTMH